MPHTQGTTQQHTCMQFTDDLLPG